VAAADQPLSHFFSRGRNERGVGGLRRAVDDEARARQRLEGGCDRPIGIVIMGPSHATTQRDNAVGHRPGFVGAKAELAAGIGHVLSRPFAHRSSVIAGALLMPGGR
jgi:hypothetical protein